MNGGTESVDPILENRIRARVQAGVDEAEATFRTHAFSPSLSDGETAVSLFFPDGTVWTDGTSSAPFQAALLRVWIEAVHGRLASGAFGPEDVVVSNDPFDGGGTVCDLKMAAPVGMGASGTGWVAVTGHYPDTGARVAGGCAPGATTVHEEGVRIPLTTAAPAVFDILAANSRFPDALRIDLAAHREALDCARSRLAGLATVHGWDRILTAVAQVRDRAVRALAKARAELTPGTYVRRDRLSPERAERAERDPGAFRPIQATATVSASHLRLDFADTGPASDGPTNATRSSVTAACFCGLRGLFPEIPACGFSPEDLEIQVPDGSLLSAEFPDAVGGTSEVLAERVASVVVEALSESVHGRGVAVDGGGGNLMVLEGADEGRPYSLRLAVGSGGGASGRGDGLANVDPVTRLSLFPPVEAIERTYPVRVVAYRVRTGSGGAGRYRGGDGTVIELETLTPARLSLYVDRMVRGAGGHHRGARGQTSKVAVFRDGHWTSDTGGRLQSLTLLPGDRVRIETAGGGGSGHPYERAIRLLTEDVASGRLSRKAAAKQHGVVFTSSEARDYDSARTFKLRSYRLTSSDVDDFLDEIETLQD